MTDVDLTDISRRMENAIEALHKEFQGLRTGRASPNLLEPIMVDAYGGRVPIVQVGTIGVPEPRLLTVQVWDRSLTKTVEKAIRDSGLGLNPQAEGQVIRVPLPDLTAERRQELAKVAHKYAESARIAVRNIRRDAMDMLKRLEKKSELSEDELRAWTDKVQAVTDTHVKRIDESLMSKEKEIMQV